MENFLFIGGAGFIGSSIIHKMLQQDGSQNITVLEPPQADISRLKDCAVGLVRGTLDDTELIEQTIIERRITSVVHLVSSMTPDSGYYDYLTELCSVVRPTIRLLSLCSSRRIKLIYFSSGGAIYGESNDGRPFRETDRQNPISYYGLSKQIIEANIRFEHRVNGLQYLILRPSNPYGPGQNIHARQGLIAVAIGKLLDRQPITVWGDGSSVRDYIYIDDLACVVEKVLCSNVANEAINIGSGEGLSVKDILGHISDIATEPVRIQNAPIRKSDVKSVVLDTTRMRQLYHKPLTPIRQGIRNFYEKTMG